MERPLEERDVTPKAVKLLVAVVVLCGMAAIALALFADGSDRSRYLYVGNGAFLAAGLLRWPFALRASRLNRQADKARARTMTAVQRESSGLSGL